MQRGGGWFACRRDSLAADTFQVDPSRGHQFPMLRCVLRLESQRGQPRHQPLPHRDTQRRGGDAGVHDNSDFSGPVGEEAVDHSNVVVQWRVLLCGEFGEKRWGVEGCENDVWDFGNFWNGGDV